MGVDVEQGVVFVAEDLADVEEFAGGQVAVPDGAGDALGEGGVRVAGVGAEVGEEFGHADIEGGRRP